MTTAAQLMVKVGADISGLQRGLAQANGAIQGAASRMGASMSAAGRTMTAALTLPLAGIGVAAAKAATDFDKEMRNIQSISKQSDASLRQLGDTILDLSTDMTRNTDSAANLAAGFYQIQSSGFAGAGALQVLEASAKAGSAGLTTTAVAAKGITAALNAYGKTSKEANRVSDILFRTVDIGVITFEELSTQLGDIVSVGARANVPLEQLGAAMATLTKAGISAPEAATGIKQLMLSFISPSQEAAKVAKALGVELDYQALASKGLYGALQDVYKATGGNVEIMSALFPNVRALNAALALTRGNMQPFADDLDKIANSAGATDAAFREQTKSFAAQMANFKNTMQALLIMLGTELMPILTQIAQDIKPMIQAFADLPDPAKKAIVQIGLLVAALGPILMIAGPIVSAIGSIGSALGGLLPAIGGALAGVAGGITAAGAAIVAVVAAVILAIVGVFAAFKTNFLGFRDYLAQVWQGVKAGFDFIMTVISAFWRFITLQITWGELKSIIGGAFAELRDTLAQVWSEIVAIFTTAIKKLAAVGGAFVKWVKGGMKGGFGELVTQAKTATSAIDGTTAAVGRLHQRLVSIPIGGLANTPTEAGGWQNIMSTLPTAQMTAPFMDLGALLGDGIASGAGSGIDEAVNAWESALSSFVEGARGNLERLAPEGFFADMTAPGANGPFENIFRAMDVAVNGANSQWAAQLGLDQATAAQIVRDFQAGLITEQVRALIDIPMLTGMIERQQLGQAMTQAFVKDVAKAAGVSGGAVMKALLPATGAAGGATPQPILDSAAGLSTTLTGAFQQEPALTTLLTGGKNIATGLATGMTNNVQLLKDAANTLVEAVLSTVDSFATQLQDKGAWMVQMLADGLRGNVETLTTAATDVVNAMLEAMQAAVTETTPAAPPTGPTAPPAPPTQNGSNGIPGAGRSVTVNVYNPTGTPTEKSVMRSMKTLAALGVLNPV